MSLFPAYASGSSKYDQEDSSITPSFQFTSFKPPSPPKTEEPDVIIVDESKGEDVQIIDEKQMLPSVSYHRKRRHKRREKKEKKKRRRYSSSSSDSEISTINKSKPTTSETIATPKWSLLKSKPSALEIVERRDFMLDHRREIENLQFGKVYTRDLAKFPSRYRQCFGNSSDGINRLFFGDYSKNEGKQGRYFKKSKGQANVDEFPTIISKQKTSTIDILPEFIPFDNKMVVDGESYVYDPKLQMYRRVDMDQISEDYLLKQEDLLYPTTSSNDLLVDNKRLNRLLTENPHDIRLWKEFLHLQDRLFFEQRSKDHKEDKLSDIALLERKLSVLEKAIEKNPANVELKILRLNVAREIGWDVNRLKDEWRKLEFNHVNDPFMWINRLQFERGGNFANFAINRQNTLYDHCLERFSAVLTGQLITHPPSPDGEHYLIDFLSAKIRFLFDSGHTEQGIASIQALLEFNFNRPQALDSVPLKDKRQFFEPFWDSNQPRIGDDGALGWMETVKGQLKPNEPVPESSEDEDTVCKKYSGLRDAGLWLELERFRESKHWLPWRNAEEPEDAQRVVLYDDIVGILYSIEEPRNRLRLFLESLKFSGFRFNTLKGTWYDEELAFRALEVFSLLPKLKRPTFSGVDEFENRICSRLEKLFPDSPIYRIYIIYIQFDHSAYTLSQMDAPAKEKLKRYRKMAKSILDDDRWRNQLVFYEAYARGLNGLSSFQEACSVAETSLVAAKSIGNMDDPVNSISVLSLISIWMENQLFHVGSSPDEILQKLAIWTVTGNWSEKPEAVATTTILKAKNVIAERLAEWKCKNFSTQDEFVNLWMGSYGTFLAHLAAMFNYIISPRNLVDAFHIYEEMRQVLKASSTGDWIEKDLERLWMWEIQLADYHVRSNPSAPPRLLTQTLEAALNQFPSNPDFLKFYVDKHLGGQLMVKLRRFFDHLLDNEKKRKTNSEIIWMAAIYSEFSRYIKLKDEQLEYSAAVLETNRLRNVLARSVESCPNSVVLWRLRLKLEMYLGERESVKRIFYLAIRQCPWAKDLYMDAIGLLPDEGQSIVDLMLEKGLRIRLPWEELQLLRKAAERD